MTKVAIKLPGNEYPYKDCEILEGSIEKIGEEKIKFKTTSKAGITRLITVFPNGLTTEQTEGE